MTTPGLTPRELNVLRGIADGLQNKEIGRALHITEDTVKTHGRRLFAKLGARGRAHAVTLAYQAGIFTAAPPGCHGCVRVRAALARRRAVRLRLSAAHPWARLYDHITAALGPEDTR